MPNPSSVDGISFWPSVHWRYLH